MTTLIDLTAKYNGEHYIEVGLDSSVLVPFSWQLWITKYGERAIDWCQVIGLNFITVMGGDLWVHNSDTAPRCNLYGEQKDCIIGVVTNEEPTKLKLFDSLGVHTDGQWEITSIIIPADMNHPHGMESKIPKERFKRRTGVWKAEFLRNMKTSSDVVKAIEAISGEPLMGYSAYMVLENVNNPTGERVKLFKVSVESTKVRSH